MTDRGLKIILTAGAALIVVAFAFLAFTRPGYLTNPMYIAGLVLVEFLAAAVFLFRRIFFALILVSFLMAGINLPVGPGWTVVRWVVLGAGALVGTFIMLKERQHHFGLFHVLALFAVLAALVSAAVSRYPGFALLKASSLVLLFLYAGTGARLAVTGRENQFFTGLLAGCEMFVGAVGACYLAGIAAMGNPNSLGAAMAVIAPILLWGVLLGDSNPWVHHRRQILFVLSMFLVFHSHARAGIAAAFISCGLLCLVLRKYRLLIHGILLILILVAASAVLVPAQFTQTISSLTESVVFKGKDPGLGLLASRKSPWQSAMDSIEGHFWFGTGFGTADNGLDARQHLSNFSTSADVSSENGSSYLAITTWVGVLGVLPFILMLLLLTGRVIQTLLWMRKTGSPSHPAIPLAMVILAGLFHAGFEDWLFAPGYYVCVFFWSLAFVLVDVAPSRPLPDLAFAWRPTMRQGPDSVFAGR